MSPSVDVLMSQPNEPPPAFFGPELLNGRLWKIQIRNAVGYLTRLPGMRSAPSSEVGLPVSAARAFPIVGAALGLIGGLAYGLGALLGFPPLVAALLGVGAVILATGARPEEALSRLAEGFGRGSNVEGKLSIMSESPIGAIGTVVLMLAVGAKIGAIADLKDVALVVAAMVTAGAVSRALIPTVARYLDPVVPADEPRPTDRPDFADLLVGGGLATLLALIALDWTGLIALLAAAICVAGFALLAKRQIGGYSEQTLVSVQQVAEVAFFVILAALR